MSKLRKITISFLNHAIGEKSGYFPLGMGLELGSAGMADKALIVQFSIPEDLYKLSTNRIAHTDYVLLVLAS